MKKKIIDFILFDIWRISTNEISKIKYFFISFLRIIILSIKGFVKDSCNLRASALTYYSLLSIVPIIAMLFGIAKGFGMSNILENVLRTKLNAPGQEQVLNYILKFSNSFLENTKGGIIAGIGIVILFLSIIKLLSNIEISFNHIWGIKKNRTYMRKISDYLSFMLIAPFLFIISSSLTVLISSQINFLISKFEFLSFLSSTIFFFMKFLPYIIIWILFSFIYLFMPNTKVNFKSGLIAGIIAGTLYQLTQYLYITFQLGVSNINAIYGSFAALPLFLFWLQISWLIILFGAEVSFAAQNVKYYEYEPDFNNLSFKLKNVISCSIMEIIINNFRKDIFLSLDEISEKLKLPRRITNIIIFNLIKSKLLTETTIENKSVYIPSKPLNKLTISFIVKQLNNLGENKFPYKMPEEIKKMLYKIEKNG